METEKHKIVMNVISSHQEFLHLKELEDLTKVEGISQKELKECLKFLVSKGTLKTDKIGSTVYYWSFSEIENEKLKSEELKQKNKELHDKIEVLKSFFQEQKDKTKESEEVKQRREQLNNELEVLRLLEKELNDYINSCAKHEGSDDISKLKADIEKILSGVNRWTDNIFNMKSWFKRKFPAIMDENLEKEFKIPADLDYFSID